MGISQTKWTLGIVAIVIIAVAAIFVYQSKVSNIPSTQPTSQESTTIGKITDITFVNHIQAKLPEQDVFIQSKDDSSKVIRVEGETASDPSVLAQTVYATAVETPHDPFKVGDNPLGPFQKGVNLGFNLEDWLAATGKGTYSVDGDDAELSLSFTNLVPNSTYTVWCSRITFPPTPNVVDRPCGAADGSENVFTTDENGNGLFSVKMEPLEPSTKETVSAIALAYHSDGKTYAESPGNFGLNSHVQIFYLLPAQ
ncbi:MAG: hypothetical protein HYW63_00780 [Candidatus Levybacteria bacterium]|nr:hypothetical protein [Candidatus Levybacteria bacterium]